MGLPPASLALTCTVFRRVMFALRPFRGSCHRKRGVKAIRHYFPNAVGLFLPNRHVLAAVGRDLAVGTLGGQLVGIERVSEVTCARHFHFVDLPVDGEPWTGHPPRPTPPDGIFTADRRSIRRKTGSIRRVIGDRTVDVPG